MLHGQEKPKVSWIKINTSGVFGGMASGKPCVCVTQFVMASYPPTSNRSAHTSCVWATSTPMVSYILKPHSTKGSHSAAGTINESTPSRAAANNSAPQPFLRLKDATSWSGILTDLYTQHNLCNSLIWYSSLVQPIAHNVIWVIEKPYWNVIRELLHMPWLQHTVA